MDDDPVQARVRALRVDRQDTCWRPNPTWSQVCIKPLGHDDRCGWDVMDKEAVDIVAQCLTALERSAPAEPGYGEIQYRVDVMKRGVAWLEQMRDRQ